MSLWADLDEDVRRDVVAVALLAVSALGFLALYAGRPGGLGDLVRRGLLEVFGHAAVAWPAAAAVAGGALLSGVRTPAARALGAALGLGAAAGLLHLHVPLDQAFAAGARGAGGGLLGASIDWLLIRALGPWGARVVLAAILVEGAVLLTHLRLGHALTAVARFAGRAVASFVYVPVEEASGAPAGRESAGHADPPPAAAPVAITEAAAGYQGTALPDAGRSGAAALLPGAAAAEGPAADLDDRFAPVETFAPAVAAALDAAPADPRFDQPAAAALAIAPASRALDAADPPAARRRASRVAVETREEQQLTIGDLSSWALPPLDLLRRRQRATGGRSQQGRRDASQRARALEETLASFGVQVRVVDLAQGPTITRFELQPGAGVKVSRIASLADDIALALAATDVRIVAPIPGKSVVGVEVPNVEVTPVFLRDVLETDEFRTPQSVLTVALGEDIAGRPVVSSLERLLHVLIGGATGSGKSITLNSLLVSLLYRARPDEVKLLLIDPKMVELSVYNGIPHLMAPVITEPKRAAGALRSLVKEMERRYMLFTECGTRDIGRYNEQALSGGEREPLPFIVVVIDELADLMLVARADVENSIQRLSQMARAAGIHLVVATQRPSVDVITGVIKANIPTRIALAVSSQVDSRTILDGAGAEKLVGRGDMLFHPMGASKSMRLQGAYVGEAELEAVLAFLRTQGTPQYNEAILEAEGGDESAAGGEDGDSLFGAAVRVVAETGQASVSMLQRRLRVGFTRAGRLIDMMENHGYVGPHQGPKPREVLITMEGYRRLFGASGESE